jgi:hypothetical protein
MKRHALGVFLASLALFVWGAVFWMSPLPYGLFGKTADDGAAGQALLRHFPDSATYVLPGMYNPPDRLEALTKAGPIATVHIRRAGSDTMSPATLGLGFMHELAVVTLLAILLHRVRESLPVYRSRVKFVTAAGVASAAFGNLAMPIWWQHPWPFYLINSVYEVVAWFLVGLVLARFIRPVVP